MPLEGSGVRREAPGTRPHQDLEYGSAVLRKPKKKTVSIFRYLCACFIVVSHFCFIVLTAWVSCSFARWEELDEPLQEPIQLRIVAGTHSEQADCWNPTAFLGVHRPGTARASGFCEMRASSLPSNRFRSFVALMLGPLVVIETVLHWFQGTHFPLTASQSFFIVSTGREMERKVPVVDVASILILTAMAIFFFYCGMWNIALLYMRVHDLESESALVQCCIQLLVCCLSMLSKLKPSLMFVVIYLLYSCILTYVDPLFLAFIPTVLLLVLILAPANRRRVALGESSGLLPTVKEVLLDLASLVYEHA